MSGADQTPAAATKIVVDKAARAGAFGAFLVERWDKLRMSQAEFCRRVGSPAGWVQQIRMGVKTPPMERMERWADALELTDERQTFLDLAAVQHLPLAVRPRFVGLVLAAAVRA